MKITIFGGGVAGVNSAISLEQTRTNENGGAIDIEKIDCHMGRSSLSILRSDFKDILISKLESLGVVIQYAHTVTRIETKNPGVAEVYFTEIRFEKTTNIIIGVRGFASSLFNRDEKLCSVRNENSKNTDFDKVAAAMSRGWSQYLPLNG